jgi:hypothetical protein
LVAMHPSAIGSPTSRFPRESADGQEYLRASFTMKSTVSGEDADASRGTASSDRRGADPARS